MNSKRSNKNYGDIMGLALPSAAMAELLGEIDDIVKNIDDDADNSIRLGLEIAALLDKAADDWPAAQDTPEHKEEEARILKNLFYEDWGPCFSIEPGIFQSSPIFFGRDRYLSARRVGLMFNFLGQIPGVLPKQFFTKYVKKYIRKT